MINSRNLIYTNILDLTKFGYYVTDLLYTIIGRKNHLLLNKSIILSIMICDKFTLFIYIIQ